MVCAMEIPHKKHSHQQTCYELQGYSGEEEFKDVFTCAKHVRENFIDITLKGVTKGDAITELIEKLGIDKKDTYAFGDADNDVEMMQVVGTGIAMGRHSEKVGEVASMVTGTVKEEGITMALKKLGLI